MGKYIRNNGKTEYLVTGVYEDMPPHSHMQVDAMLSFATYAHLVGIAEEDMNSWMWDGFYTYVLLDERATPQALRPNSPPW